MTNLSDTGARGPVPYDRFPDRTACGCAAAMPCLGGSQDEGDNHNDDDNSDNDVSIAVKTRTKPKKPNLYKVLLLNDDYTPMEFVVLVLKRFFSMDIDEATRVMLHVHQQGVGICGVFSYEIAETKVNQVMDFSRQNQHPLQ